MNSHKGRLVFFSLMIFLSIYAAKLHAKDSFAVLQPNEVLIVFHVGSISDDEAHYVADIFKAGKNTPIRYQLCSEQYLNEIVDDGKEYYNDSRVWSAILSPLSKELSNVSTIFFIPAGKLWDVSIEYCLDAEGRMFCEDYEVYRLYSPDILRNKEIKRNFKNISIWGGIEYRTDLPGISKVKYLPGGRLSNLGFLEYSLTAAVTVNDELLQKGFETELFIDTEASEDKLKVHDWRDTDIFFIATHGLVLSEYDGECDFRNDDVMEDHALALTGAAYALEGGVIPEGIENGLITAAEISELDLSNISLGVISACRGSHCEIRGDDCYGLMRGFKQAGVKSLIMATDYIVDYVSSQLWIRLFQNLAKGMTKREAFLEGLKYIRTMDNGFFSHPKYWTPYVLIDGIE